MDAFEKFVFLRPFPECPRLIDTESFGEADSLLGPFTLREAMRIFWKLKELRVAISWDVYVDRKHTDSQGNTRTELLADTEGVFNYAVYRAHWPSAYANETPAKRCVPRSSFAWLDCPNAGVINTIGKPGLICEYPQTTGYDEMEYYFPLHFYCNNRNSHDRPEATQSCSSTHFGRPYQPPQSGDDGRQTVESAQISIFGKSVTAYFSMYKSAVNTNGSVSYAHSISVEEEYF